jgi:DNA-binding NarL/FixJ family response regulator
VNLRVVVVDDHHVFRSGLRAVLASDPHIEVVGEAGEAREGFHVVEKQHPDVVVLDVMLPGMSGVAAMRELRRRAPESRVLMLTAHSEERYVLEVLAAGALGYALKTQEPAELVAAVRQVGRGERYLAPALKRALVDPSGPTGRPMPPAVNDVLHLLSEREREVFELAVRGMNNESIGRELCISVKTVETHRGRINRKLGIHSTAQLIRFAALNGLLPA